MTSITPTPKRIARHFRENQIDVVIYFAGLKTVGGSVQKPLEYFDNNVNSTSILCCVLKEFGCKRMVFSSSVTVYSIKIFPHSTKRCRLALSRTPTAINQQRPITKAHFARKCAFVLRKTKN
ncbi:MAG: NAD-dependent epimerase/dehydratase family protein [Clostridia bacterium]|nr:NAD-dependent epimerase/dehydratase family protein [Clostridia bacterium]